MIRQSLEMLDNWQTTAISIMTFGCRSMYSIFDLHFDKLISVACCVSYFGRRLIHYSFWLDIGFKRLERFLLDSYQSSLGFHEFQVIFSPPFLRMNEWSPCARIYIFGWYRWSFEQFSKSFFCLLNQIIYVVFEKKNSGPNPGFRSWVDHFEFLNCLSLSHW